MHVKTGLAALLLALGMVYGLRGMPGSREAQDDPENVEIAGNLELTEWAAYPLLANPVALAVDDRGRVYVTETARRKTSNLDIREHRGWMTEDLSFRSVEDKRNFLRERLAPEHSGEHAWLDDRNGDGSVDWKDLAVQSEKIHQLTDVDGNGSADTSIVFAEDFRTEVTGVAAGVMPFRDDVYATIAPNLWKLTDTDGDGRSDQRNSLIDGFGVHFGYAGHDMSGLTMGPDGKLYWSIGDIGVNTTGPDGRRWEYPNQGVVARANPDGSDFEIFAHGLRNPQELAFDRFGNLISVDNDGDRSGEHERIVYITEDSDAGWRMNWQFGKYGDEANSDYVVWMEEGLHKPYFDGQPAYITPPVALYHDGPAGFAYDPGTALTDRWRNHFFVSLFTGSAAQARLHAFTLEQDGAGFSLRSDEQVMKGVLATGIAFSPDGALYLADWGEGWNTGPKGRVWKLDTPGNRPGADRRTTAEILRLGMDDRSAEELSKFLSHADMRVRMQSQFELVERGSSGREALLTAARQNEERLARLHGIWGLGQIGRDDPDAVKPLMALLLDDDPEVRAQTAKVMGEVGFQPAADRLVGLLDEDEARPKFFAAVALGKLGHRSAFDPIVRMIARDAGSDPYLRHAGITGLTHLGLTDALVQLHDHPSRSVRLAAVVALRRLRAPGIAEFLDDSSSDVVEEAARGIHDDFSIREALPRLAASLDRTDHDGEPLLRRAINANLRLGTAEQADRLARFAFGSSAPARMRAEAVAALSSWPSPSPFDRVTGRYRHFGARDTSVVRNAVAGRIDGAWEDASDTVRVEAAEMVASLELDGAAPAMFEVVQDSAQPTAVRVAALRALAELGDERTEQAVRTALGDEDDRVREAALGLMPGLELPSGELTDMYGTVLESGTIGQRQAAFRALGRLSSDEARDLLAQWMERLSSGRVDPAVRLDLLQAVRESGTERLSELVRAYEAARPDTALADFSETLVGGSAQAGRDIVFEHTTAQCVRCHQIDGEGGTVGPPLGQSGSAAGRRYILESLVRPGASLARGYGTTTFTLQDGRRISGSVVRETGTFVVVERGDGSSTRLSKSEITERTSSPSAMPSMAGILSKEEIRDVIEFLAGLR